MTVHRVTGQTVHRQQSAASRHERQGRQSRANNRESVPSTIVASHYGCGDVFNGRKAADGSVFNKNAMTAASRTLPFGTKLTIRNPSTQQTATATITDRGPYARGRNGRFSRDLDASCGVAHALGYFEQGVARLEVIGVQLGSGRRARK